MTQISVEFDLPLPNEYLVDHSFSEGKSRKYTYHGPDKIYLQIGEDGTEKHGPLTADEIADGRPVPADVVEWLEVDCETNPLICQLRGPVVNELQEETTGENVHPESPVVEGYPQYTYPTPLMPAEIFNKFAVKVIDGNIVPTVFGVNEKLHSKETPLTWDNIRRHRDQLLQNSDAQIADDMPQSVKDAWIEYRQKLRDLPAVMENAGVEPNIAYYMFPDQPFVPAPPSDDT
jgi:hypothetical protein